MRIVARMLAFIVASGAVTLVLADPPASQQQPSAVSSPAAAPSAPAAPASSAPPTAAPASQTKPAPDVEEKQLIAEGYKPEMRNGQKVFCRRDEELGSRLGSVKRCGTAEELKISQRVSKDQTDNIQRTQTNPAGH